MIIGKKIIKYEEIDSTNDEARRQIKKGEGEGLVIIADMQTKGRGKPGSRWFSPKDLGLYISAVVKPYKNPNAISDITRITAQAVVALLKNEFNILADIKPPNDVLVKQKKICGILVERDARGNIIIGIGLNVNHPQKSFPTDLIGLATSVKIVTGKKSDLKTVEKALLMELNREYLAYLGKI